MKPAVARGMVVAAGCQSLRFAIDRMCMREKLVALCGFGLAVALGLAGCRKASPPVQINPDSAENTVKKIMDQGVLLSDSVKRKDFAKVDEQAYFLHGLTQALYSRLDAEQKQNLKAGLDEVARVAEELDHSAGRRHEEATEASMQKLQAALKEFETQFKAGKRQ